MFLKSTFIIFVSLHEGVKMNVKPREIKILNNADSPIVLKRACFIYVYGWMSSTLLPAQASFFPHFAQLRCLDSTSMLLSSK